MELFANDTQTVEANDSVVFTTALSSGNQSIIWRAGSGIITLRGLGPQLRSRFRVSVSTPAAVGEFNSISATTLVDVPAGCCTQISLANIGVPAIDTENVDLIVERVA